MRVRFVFVAIGLGLASCNVPEAEKQAESIVNNQFVRCGDSEFSKSGDSLREFKEFTWKVEPHELSAADRLNGVEFRGQVIYNYSAYRDLAHIQVSPSRFVPLVKCWGEWASNSSFTVIAVVEKKNGVWNETDSTGAVPECSEVNLPKCAR